MNEIEGYVERTSSRNVCLLCKWLRADKVQINRLQLFEYYCSHPVWYQVMRTERYIGDDVISPNWCPVGKAVLPTDKKDC
jgi:hypothetical protein